MRGDSAEGLSQVRKASERAEADSAAARFVPRKRRAIDERGRDARRGQGPRGSRAGRTGAYYEDGMHGIGAWVEANTKRNMNEEVIEFYGRAVE